MNIFADEAFKMCDDPDLVGFNCDYYSDYILKSPSSRSSRRSNRNKQVFIKTTQIVAGTCFFILLTSRGAKADEQQTWSEYGKAAFWGVQKVVPKTWVRYIFTDGIPLPNLNRTSLYRSPTSVLLNLFPSGFGSIYSGVSISKCILGAYMARDPRQRLTYSISAVCQTTACISNLVCTYNSCSAFSGPPVATMATTIGIGVRYSADLMKVYSDCKLLHPMDPILLTICVAEGVKKTSVLF